MQQQYYPTVARVLSLIFGPPALVLTILTAVLSCGFYVLRSHQRTFLQVSTKVFVAPAECI